MIRNNSNALKFNYEVLRDKIYACWMGKNIGGTLGCPVEGTRSLCDITGFSSKGVLPNDDLDLQLVWLRAVDEVGIENITAQVLCDYWQSYVGPWWQEYGICKRNMKEGILPPLSGAIDNDWCHSNGAWIRTEIWACLSPGMPEQSAKLAFEDACVDHGLGEGTYAAVFVAALEAAAFVISDIRQLIQIGLSKIPADCRVAKSIQIVIDGYDKGVDWKDTRQLLVNDSEDLGWFQAPANVSYAVLGLLYGEGDFKKTILYAINCGDDTDCGGATAGSIMGIAFGSAIIPDDWRQFIGDEIKTVSIVTGHGGWPATNTELTEFVMEMLPASTRNRVTHMSPSVLKLPDSKSDLPVVIWDGMDDFSALKLERFMGSRFMEKISEIAARTQYALKTSCVYADLWVEFDREPVMTAESTLTGRVTIALKRMPEQKWFRIKWYCPEGWSVTGVKNISACTRNGMFWDTPDKPSADELVNDHEFSSGEFTIRSGERVDAVNRLLLEVSVVDRPLPMFVPIVILG